MDNSKTTLSLNLSNQANTCKSKRAAIAQYNFLVIIGLMYLEERSEKACVPVSVNIDRLGELTINGIDGISADDRNIFIHTDKKVTKSNEYNEAEGV